MRDRYPLIDRYPVRERFPYREKDRYPIMRDNRYPYDKYPVNDKRYPPMVGPGDRGPYPYYDYLNQRFPGSSRYPDEYSRPDTDRFREGYPGRLSPPGNDPIFPDKRYRPSSFLNRYPFVDITHNARRPEPEGSKRYPPGKYPLQSNRFPGYPGRPGKHLN